MQTLELQPELGVPIPPDMPYIDLRERAEAACRAMELLEGHGLEVPDETLEDKEIAAKVTTAYAADPITTSQKANNVNAASLTPASLRNIRSYLDEFGHAVVTHAVEVRHLVTNRLLEESVNPDPRIRIRALELLGKVSDVGLFTDKQEITITHQTTDELRERLRGKLQKLIRRQETIDVGAQEVNLDDELGLEPQKIGENGEKPEIFVPEEVDVDPENPDGTPWDD
jgi:hypothetical protein